MTREGAARTDAVAGVHGVHGGHGGHGVSVGVGRGRLVLTSDQADLTAARRATAEYLHARCQWADSEAVLLVVSELLSNAVLHGGGWWRLVVAVPSRQLVIEVHDRETRTPVIREANSKGAGGMGMHIVTKLVTAYEAVVNPGRTGKTVRAVWKRPAAPTTRLISEPRTDVL